MVAHYTGSHSSLGRNFDSLIRKDKANIHNFYENTWDNLSYRERIKRLKRFQFWRTVYKELS